MANVKLDLWVSVLKKYLTNSKISVHNIIVSKASKQLSKNRLENFL